jgi:hypothetical protein
MALLLAFLPVACHHAAPATKNADTGVVVRDTTKVTVVKETVLGNESRSDARSFDLRVRGQRDSLQAVLNKERALWRARIPREYQFLLRVSCFCPGQRGWLLMEVRNGQLTQARDTSGKAVPLSDWNTLSIDKMFDNLERWVERDASVQVAFDPRWHFPVYISTVARPGPDTWGLTEARGFLPRIASR